jgi:hypothetical protein
MLLEEILRSGRDTLLVGAPLLILLFLGFFRLDELLLRPKKRQVPLAPAGQTVHRGQRSFSSEPDGTPLLPSHRPAKSPSK